MFRITCLIATLIFAGCGGPKMSSVQGQVLLDGKPLAQAAIQFVPQGSGRIATGQTDAGGRFVMSTLEPRDGVLSGTYKVTISPPRDEVDKTQYGNSADAMNAPAKAPPKKAASGPAFPAKYSNPGQTPLTQEVPVKGSLKFELKSE